MFLRPSSKDIAPRCLWVFFYIKTESDLDTRQYVRCKVPGLDSIPFMKLHLQTIGFIIILNRPLLRINLVTGMIMEKETGELA